MNTTPKPANTTALFIGGPWDNRTVHLQEQLSVYQVRTPKRTHNTTGGSLGTYKAETEVHKYWRIPGVEGENLYLFVEGNRSPERIAHTFTTRNINSIHDTTRDVSSQIVEQGGDERTLSVEVTAKFTGSAITYRVTVQAFLVPPYYAPSLTSSHKSKEGS